MAGESIFKYVKLISGYWRENNSPTKLLSINGDGDVEVSDVSLLPIDDSNIVKKDPSPETLQTIQYDIEIEGDLKLNPTEATTEDTIIVWDGALSKALKYRPIEWLFNLVLGWFGWDTPQRNGAKGNGTDDDTVAFQQCLSNNQNIFLYGTYLVSGDLSINSNQHIFSNNSTIKRTGTTNTILTANSVSNWKIGGVLTIEGNGNVSGTQRGLYIIGANNFKVDNITFKNISGDPIEFDDTVPSGRGNRGLVYNLSAQNNYGSVLFNRRAEYHTVQNVNISGSSTIALKILSGNVSIIGGSIVDNANGVYLGGAFGNNNSHGVLSNLNINHNDLTGGYNATFENVEEGQTVIGCHFYSEPSGNNINIINSKGIAFTGCIIDGNITNTDATPSNNWTHLFNGCQINTGSNVTGVTQNLIFRDCFTMTGIYSNTPDPTVIQTTTDQTKTGMLTLVGSGPGTFKLQRESFGALFANSSIDDGYLAYNLGGTTLFYKVFGNGNITIGQASGTDTGERLQVNGEVKMSTPTLSTSGATKGYVDVRAILNLTNVPFTLATINALYPAAQDGDRIVCPKINTGTIYTKAATDWVITSGVLLT